MDAVAFHIAFFMQKFKIIFFLQILRVFFTSVKGTHNYNTRLFSRMASYALPKTRTNYRVFNNRYQDISDDINLLSPEHLKKGQIKHYYKILVHNEYL